MKHLLFTLAFLLSGLSFSAAREIRVIYYRAPGDAPREAYLYGTSGKNVKIPFPRMNCSDAFELPDSGEQFILLPQELPPDTPPPLGAPVVNLPADWDLAVLLIYTDMENPIFPVRVQPINASPSVFGPGKIYWVNLTDIAVGGMVGDTKLVIGPRSVEIMSPPRTDNGDYPVVIDCVTPGENKRRWLVRQTWRHIPTARQITFIHPLDPPRIASLYSVTFFE